MQMHLFQNRSVHRFYVHSNIEITVLTVSLIMYIDYATIRGGTTQTLKSPSSPQPLKRCVIS